MLNVQRCAIGFNSQSRLNRSCGLKLYQDYIHHSNSPKIKHHFYELNLSCPIVLTLTQNHVLCPYHDISIYTPIFDKKVRAGPVH